MAGVRAFQQIQTPDRNVNQLQQNIAQTLQLLLQNPLSNANYLQSIQLSIGTNVINHELGRNLLGWFVCMKNASADIYDTQLTNTQPSKTLILVSDAVVTINLMCF